MSTQFETLQEELAAGEPQVKELLQRLHGLDRYAWRMQLLDRQASMLEYLDKQAELEDNAVQDQDETNEAEAEAKPHLTSSLVDMIDRLEQHVGWVMQAMNRWCLSVLGWEILMLLLIAGVVAGLATLLGNGQPLPVLQSWWTELVARPISMAVYAVLFLSGAVLVHFKLRKIFARRIAEELQQHEPFNTPKAFLRNTRIWHSIYRPQPVGWVKRARRQLNELRKQLADQLAHPQDVEVS